MSTKQELGTGKFAKVLKNPKEMITFSPLSQAGFRGQVNDLIKMQLTWNKLFYKIAMTY